MNESLNMHKNCTENNYKINPPRDVFDSIINSKKKKKNGYIPHY